MPLRLPGPRRANCVCKTVDSPCLSFIQVRTSSSVQIGSLLWSREFLFVKSTSAIKIPHVALELCSFSLSHLTLTYDSSCWQPISQVGTLCHSDSSEVCRVPPSRLGSGTRQGSESPVCEHSTVPTTQDFLCPCPLPQTWGKTQPSWDSFSLFPLNLITEEDRLLGWL